MGRTLISKFRYAITTVPTLASNGIINTRYQLLSLIILAALFYNGTHCPSFFSFFISFFILFFYNLEAHHNDAEGGCQERAGVSSDKRLCKEGNEMDRGLQ